MRIDVHAHHLPAAYLDMLRKGDGPAAGAAHDASTLEKMIEAQTEAGIDVQVLSTGPNSPYLRDPLAADDAARAINDIYKDVVERHGGRFAAFAALPMPHPVAATREAIRCLDELGFAGVHLGCSALGRPLDDPSFTELWAELDKREAVVYVHPGGVVLGSEPGLAGMDNPVIGVTIGSAAEIATAAVRLTNVAKANPRLRIVIGLLGGSLPFLLQRVVAVANRFTPAEPSAAPEQTLVEALRRFHYDINLLPDPEVLRSARAAFGVDRFVFGSDAPSAAPLGAIRFMRSGGLSAKECEAVLGRNARLLFGERLARPRAPVFQT